MRGYVDRMIRAAKPAARLYEEVEADPGALKQAMGVVILSSVAAGLGSIGKVGFIGILMGTALLGWHVWAYLTYFIGSKLLPEPQTSASHGELLRTIGFSSAPGTLRVLSVVPGLLWVVYMISGI